MAKIIETELSSRRIIQLSSNDIISVVQSYQRIVPLSSTAEDMRNCLENAVVYVPEDV